MPKSKYPQELDTSLEIPPARDNILEVGSDIINSLRSAIFNIERTLGINPQGAIGNTLAERLNHIIDGNGNLRSDALNLSNVLSGPIIDNDVSNVAAIQESKLKLNFPTILLQDEITVLNSQLEDIQNTLNEVSNEIAIHLNIHALNRHSSRAISVTSSIVDPGDVAVKSLEEGTVQSVLEDLFDNHINYTGIDISASNNSHDASQIYFNDENISDVASAANVQDAIDSLVTIAINSQTQHQKNQHSNGMLKIGNIDTSINSGVGNILSDDFEISFNKNDGLSTCYSTIIITTPFPLGDFTLEKSDIITISDPSDNSESYVGDYEIESFTVTGSNLAEVIVFGYFSSDSTSTTTGRISKSIKAETNKAGLLIAVREEAQQTSAKTIQICNPNSVKIISNKIKPYEITSIKRFIGVTIDDGEVDVIDLYNSSYTRQTIDSVVSRINEQVAEEALNFFAYRVDVDNRSEVAIAYNLPDDSDSQHTIKITRQVDNGIDVSGYVDFEDIEIYSDFGSNYYLNGVGYEGLSQKLDSTGLSFNASGVVIGTGSSNIDFLSSGIKKGDVIIITGASSIADNKTYVIDAVSSTQLSISSDQLPSGFSGTSQTTTRFRIFHNIISFEDITFNEVGDSYGSMLAEIFLNKDRIPFYNKRLEYTSSILASSPLFSIVDFEGDISDQEFELTVSGGTDLVYFSIDSGSIVQVRGNDSYFWVTSGTKNVKLKFMVKSVSDLNTQLTSLGSDLTTIIYGFSKINNDTNLVLSIVTFDNFNGRVSGGENSSRVRSKLPLGNISLKDLSTKVKAELVEEPINDLRTSGVISGLEITGASSTSSLYSFDITSGACYVRGKKFFVEAHENFISNINISSTDKIFIAVDADGMVQVSASTPSCQCPFESSEYCLLATIEYDNVNYYNHDLRLFINDIDLKILNSITVSLEPSMGHFSDLGKAIGYAKRFSQIFTKAGIPTIHLKSGVFEVTTTFDNSSISYADWAAQSTSTKNVELYDGLAQANLVVDFPVNIIGEGDSSILKLRNQYIFSNITYTMRGAIIVPGNGLSDFTVPIDKITAGFFEFKNFRMNNCRLQLPDFEINDGTDPYFNGVTIKSVVFDMTGFTANPVDTALGPRCVDLSEVNNTSIKKGNITIDCCKFLVEPDGNSRAVINLPAETRTKNMVISNNYLIGSDDTSTIRLMDKDIWFFSTADSGANITITGNISASNFNTVSDASKPHMVIGATGWGDRISRTLRVGGNLTGEGSATFTDAIEGSLFNYNQTLTRTKYIFFENLSDTALGDSTANTTFDTLSVNGREWRSIKFNDNLTDVMRVRLEILPGETLDDITILFGTEDPADSIFGGFSLRITSENAYGDETVEQVYTSMGSVVGGLGASLEAGAQGVTNLSFSGAENKHYIANIKRSATTGYSQHMLYVQYTTTMTTVQALGGLT
jgi:hypothetical protein